MPKFRVRPPGGINIVVALAVVAAAAAVVYALGRARDEG